MECWSEVPLRMGISPDILGLEAKLGSIASFPCGVVFGLPGQVSEEKMFENEMQPEFLRFLDTIADKEDTFGWEHYSGGLSTG